MRILEHAAQAVKLNVFIALIKNFNQPVSAGSGRATAYLEAGVAVLVAPRRRRAGGAPMKALQVVVLAEFAACSPGVLRRRICRYMYGSNRPRSRQTAVHAVSYWRPIAVPF